MQPSARSSLVWPGMPSGSVFKSSNPLQQRFPFSVPKSLGGGELMVGGGNTPPSSGTSPQAPGGAQPPGSAPAQASATHPHQLRPPSSAASSSMNSPAASTAVSSAAVGSHPEAHLSSHPPSTIPEGQDFEGQEGAEYDEPLVYRAPLPTVDLSGLPRDSAAAAAAEAGLPVTAAVLASMLPADMPLVNQPRRSRPTPSPPRLVRNTSISNHSRLLAPTLASAAKVFSPESIAEVAATELRSSRQAGVGGAGVRSSVNTWRPGGVTQGGPRSLTGDSSPVRQGSEPQEEDQGQGGEERGRPERLSPCPSLRKPRLSPSPSIRGSREGVGRRKDHSPSLKAADAILTRASQVLQVRGACWYRAD